MENTSALLTGDATDTTKDNGTSAGLYFAGFAFIAVVFAVIGMKYSEASGAFGGVSFYGRYDGLAGGILHHAKAAVTCALPCLIQLLALYVLSPSPIIIPAGLIVVGFRGFVAGIAYGAVSGTDTAAQLIVYGIITLAICLASAMLLHSNKAYAVPRVRFARKSVILTAAAGFAVICEFILSYII
ncbi:MAG: hypothetical protein IJ386_01365 [Clostridia bacterium]|nr:hypothetical protein [Clostridia bacterium]